MIRYYAYYNYGGYKDLYLGNSEDTVESRYFLPLLPVYEQDETMVDQVATWKKLPAIINLSNETEEYNYPSEARVMMSHAGYKLQLRNISDKGVFALRDISGTKDTYGRSCPFAMMLVADTEEDKKTIEKVCYYVWKNIDKAEALFSSVFVNDFEVNGLRFDVAKLNEGIKHIIVSAEGTLEENTYNRPVHFFVLPDDMRFAAAFEEQQFTKDDVAVAYNLGISSKKLVYRYKPPQPINSPTGCPTIQPPSQKEKVQEQQTSSQHHSFQNALGFAKAEDLQILFDAQQKLIERIEELEKRIQELENKQI